MAFDPITFLIYTAVAIALNVVAYVLMPKPKGPKPEAVKELESPTVDAGREICVVTGTVWLSDPNILWYGDKSSRTTEVTA